ncbi:MAG: carbohydrate ABC transporter permease, partial [Actinobacteria bacterium]|nr:carbohydrate ABC transporter permease [Actinomycetota bacterium]
ISLLAMPTQVFLIPIFVMFSNLNLINNLFSLAVIYTGFNYAFGTFLMTSFYKGIPDEIIDSAKIDGANKFQVFLRIMLPLGKPAIITLGVLDFFSNWNELLVALIFNSSNKSRLLTPGLALFHQVQKAGAISTNWPLIYTGIVLSLIIPFIVYFIFQNRIASGITVGALKE